MEDSRNVPVRRSSRRIKSTDVQVIQFLSAASQEQGSMRSTSIYLECCSGATTVSEADSRESLSGNRAVKAAEESPATRMASERIVSRKKRLRCNSDSGDVSSDMEDSDELTLKELQELLQKRKKGRKHVAVGSDLDPDLKKKVGEEVKMQSQGVQDTVKYSGRCVSRRTGKGSRLPKEVLQSKTGGKHSIWSSDNEEDEEEMDDTEENESSSQSDPNAVYCICRQKRNKRFMICCDHCEEWFHGDCVGITEAHGRILEKNGEDYICPDCTSREIQNIIGRNPQNRNQAESETESSSIRKQALLLVDMEEEQDEDQVNVGKGMTTNARGTVDVLQPAPGVTGLAKCIGPACSKNALPDSVYCGRNCILLHAAATMKSLEAAKKYRQRPKTHSKVQKRSFRQRSIRSRTVESMSKAEEEHESFSKDTEGTRQHPVTPQWPTDQNCNAENLEKIVASSNFHKLSGEPVGEDKAVSAANQELPVVTCESLEGGHRSVDSEKTLVRPAKQAKVPVFGGSAFKKPTLLPGIKFTKAASTIPRRLSLLPRFKQQWLQNRQFPPALFSVVRPPQVFSPPALSKPPKSQPNDQMRQNIHRSLKQILYRRVCDSDDLQISESEIGKLAVNIEKEIFNMFLNTEAKYKSKYRSVMFHLKDPKNKTLFYRVVCGEVTPFMLVRLTSEQLLCREAVEQKGMKDEVKQVAPDLNAEHLPLTLSDMIEQNDPDPISSSNTNTMRGPVPDVFCTMLMDTTTEHSRHLFDVNCKICTGSMSADEEVEVKKPKVPVSSATQKVELKAKLEVLTCKMDSSSCEEGLTVQIGSQSPTIEFPASTEEDTITSFTPIRSHEVSVNHSSVTETIAVIPSTTKSGTETKLVLPSPLVSTVSFSKSILIKPASSPASQTFSACNSSSSSSGLYEERETGLFLSKQQTLWNGFISMHSVTKFATKACLVSGFFDCLVENLPYIIQIGGRISPHTVWDYVGKLKASVSKELCLIRFFPSSEEEEAAYVSLFSYFSSRGRFGVVANNKPHVKDLYIIPLSAKDPVPCQLLPFYGPGLESSRPHLLLGLIICQKPKCSGISQETNKKISKIKTGTSGDHDLPTDIPACTPLDNQFSKCPSISLTNSLSSISVFSKPSNSSLEKDCLIPASSTCTPLQVILNTLFGKKKHNCDGSKESPVEPAQPQTLLFDPIVQKFGHISNEEETEDDRPYDPEEEYKMEMCCGIETSADAAEALSANPTADDIAYDPEDESVFEELQETAAKIPTKKTSIPKSNSSELVEQRRMLEELNKEIELQKRQVEEQEEVLRQQKAAIGLSMAHFSVSDALLSPPSKLLQSNRWMLQLEEEMKNSDAPGVTQHSEETMQETTKKITSECPEQGGIGSVTSAKESISGHGQQNSKRSAETLSMEEPFLEDKGRIKINVPILREDVLSETEGSMLNKIVSRPKEKDEETSTEGEIESNPYNAYQDSSSILKANDCNAPFSESPGLTCMYVADPLVLPLEKAASGFENIPFQDGSLGIYPSYQNPLGGSQPEFVYSPGTSGTSHTSIRSPASFTQVKQRMAPLPVLGESVLPQNLGQMDLHTGDLPEHHWLLHKVNTSSEMNYFGHGGCFSPVSKSPQNNFCIPHNHGPQGGSFEPQYNFNHFFTQGVEQHEEQMPPHSNGENQLSLHGLYAGLSHNQSEEWRAPSRQHCARLTCYRSPRTFRVQRDLPGIQAWDARTQLQFHSQGQQVLQDGQQLRRCGPLLPTPPGGSIQMHHSRQSSGFLYQNHWRCSSHMRRSSSTETCSEPQYNADRLSSSDGGQRGREWVRCPEDWKREQDGHRRASLQRDSSEGKPRPWEREPSRRREAGWHKKEGEMKKDGVLKREQKEGRNRERDQHRKHADKNNARNQDRDGRTRKRSPSVDRGRDHREQRASGRFRMRDGAQGGGGGKDHSHKGRPQP